MKKYALLIAALATVAAVGACQKKEQPAPAAATAPAAAPAAPTTDASKPADAAAPAAAPAPATSAPADKK